MNRKKAITYSLLAHIRNTATLINGPLDIFVPLIKRSLSKMNSNNIFHGKNIYEINDYSKDLYGVDFPVPVMRSILEIIVKEVNSDGKNAFILHNDNSFSISNYAFTEFEETIRKRNLEVKEIEQVFQKFCGNSQLKMENTSSIFDFLEKNKLSLASHLSNTTSANGHDYSVEAQFVNFFKNIPPVYELLKSLYLGSILSEYIEFIPTDIQIDVELLLDTNFIISLLDLNTPESTLTCNTLIKIAQSQSYKLTIMDITIEEIKNLLLVKADNFSKTFLEKKIYIEDIYNACERRKLTKIDLERIIDNIEKTILNLGIEKITINDEIIKKALVSDEFEYYKRKRTSHISAKHDAIALYYVKEKRKKKIKEFIDVNCWFVNNAISRDYGKSSYERSSQPEIIKADDLLNILWLSSPQINQLIPSSEIADIGLSSLVSLTFTESLPKTAIIRELEDNINKYATDNITSQDILRVATRIANKQLTNIQELNDLAKEDHDLFIKRLEEESNKQAKMEAERTAAINNIVEKFKSELENIEAIKNESTEKNNTISSLENKSSENQNEIDRLRTQLEATKKDNINQKVKSWQLKSLFLALLVSVICGIIVALYIVIIVPKGQVFMNNEWVRGISSFIGASILAFVWKLYYDRYFNHANIENYKKSLD